MESVDELQQNMHEVEEKLNYAFQKPHLLILALTHRSYINENDDTKKHNERLEFLGDSVLGLLIAEHLYTLFPAKSEGELSYLRSRLVEAQSCVTYLRKLDINSYVLLGKGERAKGGCSKDSILADLFEAIIGAIYVDGTIDAARQFLFHNFADEIEAIIQKPLNNWKALLQDLCQKKYHQTPTYFVIKESGPDHQKTFHIAVSIENQTIGEGIGHSKKEAQQAAAKHALAKLTRKGP